ncbi:hypothetical protein BXY47_2620 [Dietzia kunjamensis]|uniref:hypothetical protein n=1 Tax=Dietzia kunjamensis TaxID=322509 RepID=UPI000E76795D|nr:hypothetical protein [Dietzia kunjamensis]MBB1013681.1 hypothetical protein [Dietzia kunjamensis]RKE59535.1 hypothetical protein BXY47_2620 [Dietzia kunjamensis]
MSSKPIPGEVVGKVIGSIENLDALKALDAVVAAAREYGEISQVEQSRRAAIAAAEAVQIRRLQAAENTLRMYFDRVFEERRETNRAMFERLDQAMETGDPRLVQTVVGGIVELAQSSPLSELEDFGKFWSDFGTDENPLEL